MDEFGLVYKTSLREAQQLLRHLRPLLVSVTKAGIPGVEYNIMLYKVAFLSMKNPTTHLSILSISFLWPLKTIHYRGGCV